MHGGNLSLSNSLENEIIFYDGPCGFCHRWVKFVVKKDHKAHLFLPLLTYALNLLRDRAYQVIAKIRHKLYATPEGLCPVLREEALEEAIDRHLARDVLVSHRHQIDSAGDTLFHQSISLLSFCDQFSHRCCERIA